MTCVPAPACRAALNQATDLFPQRSTASDGICAGSAHHQQNPNSDHETGDAWDLTHDPAHGCDVDALFQRIIDARDRRVKYLIRNKRILRSYDKPGVPAWTWAPYDGPNPHIHHGHCSITADTRPDVSPWFMPALPPPTPPPQEDDMPAHIYSSTDDNDPSEVLVDGGLVVVIASEPDRDTFLGPPVSAVVVPPLSATQYAAIKARAEQ